MLKAGGRPRSPGALPSVAGASGHRRCFSCSLWIEPLTPFHSSRSTLCGCGGSSCSLRPGIGRQVRLPSVCGPSPPLQGTRGHEVPQRGCSGLEAWPGSVTDLRQAPVWAPPVKGRVRERVCGHDHELLGVKSRAWVPRLSFSPSGPAWLLGQCQ